MKLLDSPVAAGGDDDLTRCRRLLSALSASSASVACFRGRWTAISATLSRLSAALDDLSAPDGASASHPLAVDLLRSLSQTLKLAVDLAGDCRSPEPPAGKLRTQSDIAAAAAALDQLAADADLLLQSGALLDTSPAEPSAAAAAAGSSRRESVRAEAKALVTRLQIGSASSRVAALDALLSLLLVDDKNVVIAADEGVVKTLVHLLGSASAIGVAAGHELREKATAAVARVAAVESCRHLLLAEGGVLLSHLARVLESEGGAARENACAALQALTLTKENAIIIGSRGGVAALLDICRAGTPSSQAAATGVLNNLARFQELHQNFEEEEGVPVLLRVLASGTRLSQENALNCLCNLSAGEESHGLKLSIFKEGALECLMNYLQGSVSERSLRPAIGLLRNVSSFRYIAEIIANSGFLPYIITSLDCPNSGTRTEAARAITELAATVGKTRKEMSEAVPRLVRMLEGKVAEEKEAAAAGLASLLSIPGYRRFFQKEEKGIVNVVQLLDPLLQNVDKKYAILVLLSISQSRKCRKQMVAAGACGFLQRLAGMQVEGAKRLLEILGRGKIFGVFPRT